MTVAASCRNCGTALVGRYCPTCGQDRMLELKPLPGFLSEWLEAVVGWETRTGRTLRALVLAPGQLTQEFAAGHRADWLHPLRLYLGISVVSFGLLAATAGAIVARFAAEVDSAGEAVGALPRLTSALPTLMFLLMPLLGAALALAFRAARRLYVEHLVFALHFTAVTFVTQAASVLLQWSLVMLAAPILAVVAVSELAHLLNAAYFYLAARRVYGFAALPTLLRLALAGAMFMSLLACAVWVALGMPRG